MAQDNDLFRTALEGKKIPILTLDHKWHKLFTQTGDNDEIHALETVVNDLLKRQGKLNTEIKSQNLFKKKLMSEIVAIMELPDSPDKNKKMEENKRLIEEANYKLMLATMNVCYSRIKQNTQDIENINQWIQNFRVQLKRQVLLKQQKEIWNDELYSYMHDIFGPDVIEMFDLKYNPKNVLNKDKDTAQAADSQNTEKDKGTPT